ncbi:MAG: ABC transporter ATP-binding protein/permease [Candidatus Omnitrophica bacterium]|nr:ABC transporter ATP-binding protein/permease [Candidatus Omnitrophota bacterium]
MKHFKNILLKNKALVVVIFISGIIASFMEGLGLGLILPLLEGVKGKMASGVPFPFSIISNFFSTMALGERIRLVAFFLVIITLFKGAAFYLNTLSVTRLQVAAIKYYRMKCYDQLMKLGMSYLNGQKMGHLQTIVITHTERLGSLVNIVASLVFRSCTLIMLMVMLFILSWKMTMISLFIVVFASVLLRKIAQRAEKSGKRLTESIKELNRTILDTLLGMKIIRFFCRQKDMTREFQAKVEDVNRNMYALARARRSLQPLFETLGVTSFALILLIGSFLLMSENKGLGLEVVLTFILIFFRILPPAMALNDARVGIRGDLPYYRQAHQFIDSQDKSYLSGGSKTIERLSKKIEFQNLEFSYNLKELIVLKNLSFSIPKGAKVGIVGHSGCGKSTIVELILRFYDPQKGNIFIDGFDLKDLNLNSWRRLVGVVSQDTFLFHDTIRANIIFAKPDSTQQEIEYAARKAHAYDFIQNLPKRYDTLVGERGVLLSGGQRQRIAIARAIIMDPDILIFDEATSSLDTESEGIVQKALDEVGEGKTVITIAHRLSTIYDSDIILVFDSGEIVQQGTHRELIKQGGLYGKLVKMQTMDDLEPKNIFIR